MFFTFPSFLTRWFPAAKIRSLKWLKLYFIPTYEIKQDWKMGFFKDFLPFPHPFLQSTTNCPSLFMLQSSSTLPPLNTWYGGLLLLFLLGAQPCRSGVLTPWWVLCGGLWCSAHCRLPGLQNRILHFKLNMLDSWKRFFEVNLIWIGKLIPTKCQDMTI